MNKLIYTLSFFCLYSLPISSQSLVIINANIIDGSGTPAFKGQVRIQSDTIAEIGTFQLLPNETIIDAKGMILTPGLIDSHSHHDQDHNQPANTYALQTNRSVIDALSQGVTTIIVGQDGFSNYPILDFKDKIIEAPLSINIGSYTGHNTLRKKILGEEPNNPYANTYLGTFYARKGNKEKAKYHFERIVNAANFSQNWYTNEAQQWLNDYK